jgi:hypothetical protein
MRVVWMSKYIRSLGPLYFAAIVALLLFASYYFVFPPLSTLTEHLSRFATIAAGFAAVLGLIQLIQLHVNRIRKRVAGQWIFSIWTLIVVAVILAMGLTLSPTHPYYKALFSLIYTPLDGAVYSLTGFFIVTATYRTFRARSLDNFLFMIAALVIIIYNAPIFTYTWSGFDIIGTWFINVLNTGALRAFRIAAATGAVVFAIRIVLAMEKRWLG